MTREEAESDLAAWSYFNDDETLITLADAGMVLEQVYDDFESRTCSTCKHYLQYQCQNGAVDTMLDPAKEMADNVKVELDFGCNKWQPKD